MDPISAGIGVVGLGLQLFGNFSAASRTREAANINVGIAGDEQRINTQKQQAMELSAKRQQLEIFRNMQRQRAQATNSAVNQGAQFGSGLQGGLAQVTDQSLFNAEGVNQNLEIGRNIFGINNDISTKRMQLAQVQGEAATDQALGSLGGALIRMGPTIGGLTQDAYAGFGRINSGSSGNYLGTPGARNTGGLY